MAFDGDKLRNATAGAFGTPDKPAAAEPTPAPVEKRYEGKKTLGAARANAGPEMEAMRRRAEEKAAEYERDNGPK